MKQINFNPRLTTVHNACPCYIHTFETGTFVWSSYINKEMAPLKTTGFLGNCHYVQQTNATGIGWHIKKENNKYLLESSNSKVFMRGSEKEIGGATKDETVWIAPAILLNGSAGTDTYTISITLETLGDPGSGHKAEFWLGLRNGNKTYPEGSVAVLDEANFASKVAAAMTAAGHTAYGSLGADEFSTNGNKVTITTTATTVTADVIQYFGIRDTSPTPDNSYAKFRIHEITIEPTEYYETIPTAFPQFNAKITPVKNNIRGKIELDNPTEAIKCMWCWGDGKLMKETLPNRTDLAPGWHYLKGVNITEGYTHPIKRFFVKHTKSRSAGEQVPPYSKASLVNKYNQLYNNWVGGMKGCASEVMKAHVLDYLYEKFYPEEEPVFGAYTPEGEFQSYIDIQRMLDESSPDYLPYASEYPPFAQFNEVMDIPGGVGAGGGVSFLLGRDTSYPTYSGQLLYASSVGTSLIGLANYEGCNASTNYTELGNALITEVGSATSMVNPIEGILPTSQIGTPSGGNGSIFNSTTINIFIDEADPIYEGWTLEGDTNGDGIVNTQDLFAVLENWLSSTEEYDAAQAGGMPWNGGQSGRVETYGRCCTGELDYVYPAITLHNGKFWELKDQSSNGKTEPGSFLGRNDWEPLKIKSFRGKKENIIKRLENKRKKSIFELEDPKAVIYSGSLDSTTRGRAVTSSTIELENLDKLRPEINKSSRIT